MTVKKSFGKFRVKIWIGSLNRLVIFFALYADAQVRCCRNTQSDVFVLSAEGCVREKSARGALKYNLLHTVALLFPLFIASASCTACEREGK